MNNLKDVYTLLSLNKEAIEEDNKNYIVLSDTLIVPKFIPVRELYIAQANDENTSSK